MPCVCDSVWIIEQLEREKDRDGKANRDGVRRDSDNGRDVGRSAEEMETEKEPILPYKEEACPAGPARQAFITAQAKRQVRSPPPPQPPHPAPASNGPSRVSSSRPAGAAASAPATSPQAAGGAAAGAVARTVSPWQKRAFVLAAGPGRR